MANSGVCHLSASRAFERMTLHIWQRHDRCLQRGVAGLALKNVSPTLRFLWMSYFIKIESTIRGLFQYAISFHSILRKISFMNLMNQNTNDSIFKVLIL